VIAFRRERKREPGFIPPSSEGISYANVNDHIPVRSEDPYADKHEVSAQETGYEKYSYSAREREDDPFGRPSMDGYGYDARANDGRASVVQTMQAQAQSDETSRTMQLAYSDPCEFGSLGGNW
jgi:hypothetical protein